MYQGRRCTKGVDVPRASMHQGRRPVVTSWDTHGGKRDVAVGSGSLLRVWGSVFDQK